MVTMLLMFVKDNWKAIAIAALIAFLALYAKHELNVQYDKGVVAGKAEQQALWQKFWNFQVKQHNDKIAQIQNDSVQQAALLTAGSNELKLKLADLEKKLASQKQAVNNVIYTSAGVATQCLKPGDEVHLGTVFSTEWNKANDVLLLPALGTGE